MARGIHGTAHLLRSARRLAPATGVSALALASFLLACGLLGASPLLQATITSTILTDTVDIDVTNLDGGTPLLIDDEGLRQSFSIENRGMRCWVRARAITSTESINAPVKQDQWLSKGWIRGEDGWFYLTSPLAEGEKVIVETTAHDPRPLNTKRTEAATQLEAQAIQQDQFEPQFTNGKPWGDATCQAGSTTRKETKR